MACCWPYALSVVFFLLCAECDVARWKLKFQRLFHLLVIAVCMALHLVVDTTRLIRRDTWQVIVYRLTSDEEESSWCYLDFPVFYKRPGSQSACCTSETSVQGSAFVGVISCPVRDVCRA